MLAVAERLVRQRYIDKWLEVNRSLAYERVINLTADWGSRDRHRSESIGFQALQHDPPETWTGLKPGIMTPPSENQRVVRLELAL